MIINDSQKSNDKPENRLQDLQSGSKAACFLSNSQADLQRFERSSGERERSELKEGRKAHAAVSIEAGKLKCKTED